MHERAKFLDSFYIMCYFDTVIVNSSDISTDHLVGSVRNFEVVLGSNIQDEITNRTPALLLQLLDGKRLFTSLSFALHVVWIKKYLKNRHHQHAAREVVSR